MLITAFILAALAAPAEFAHRDGANLQRPQWSPNGAKLSWEANFHDKKQIELWVATPGQGAPSLVRRAPQSTNLTAGFATAASGGVAHELSWAPSALGRFVYAASTDQSDYDLFIDGGAAVAPGPGADGAPAWSPDGARIAFTSARTGQGDLYLVDVAQIELPPKRISNDPTSAEIFVSWSADSRSLAWIGHAPAGDSLWVLDSLQGQPRRVGNGEATRPSWAPVGRALAWYQVSGDGFDLYVGEAGKNPVKVASKVVLNGTGPTWSPDGAHLIFALNDDDRADPIVAARVSEPARQAVLALGTVGNGDLDIAQKADGSLWIAWVAQGSAAGGKRDYKRLYTARLPALP